MDGHDEVVRREFTRQATTFTPSGWAASGIEWITEQVGPTPDEQILEVAADAAGQRNLVFEIGDATRLSYVDESFDVVVTRLSVHHFADPLAAVREVCRHGGRLVTIDMIAVDGVEAARDLSQRTRDNPLLLRDWLDRTETSEPNRAAIEAAPHAELDGGSHTGLRPHLRDGELWISHVWTAILAVPRSRPG